MIEAARVRSAPPLTRIVVGVDPPASARAGADACGIVAAGLARGRRRLCAGGRDACERCAPAGWAARGDRALSPARGRRAGRRGQPGRRHGARRCCARSTATVPVKTRARDARQVAARRAGGGALRAGPRQARRRAFAALEDEMCDFGLDGLSSGALARPARRAGLGGDGADGDAARGAAHPVAVTPPAGAAAAGRRTLI